MIQPPLLPSAILTHQLSFRKDLATVDGLSRRCPPPWFPSSRGHVCAITSTSFSLGKFPGHKGRECQPERVIPARWPLFATMADG